MEAYAYPGGVGQRGESPVVEATTTTEPSAVGGESHPRRDDDDTCAAAVENRLRERRSILPRLEDAVLRIGREGVYSLKLMKTEGVSNHQGKVDIMTRRGKGYVERSDINLVGHGPERYDDLRRAYGRVRHGGGGQHLRRLRLLVGREGRLESSHKSSHGLLAVGNRHRIHKQGVSGENEPLR